MPKFPNLLTALQDGLQTGFELGCPFLRCSTRCGERRWTSLLKLLENWNFFFPLLLFQRRKGKKNKDKKLNSNMGWVAPGCAGLKSPVQKLLGSAFKHLSHPILRLLSSMCCLGQSLGKRVLGMTYRYTGFLWVWIRILKSPYGLEMSLGAGDVLE